MPKRERRSRRSRSRSSTSCSSEDSSPRRSRRRSRSTRRTKKCRSPRGHPKRSLTTRRSTRSFSRSPPRRGPNERSQTPHDYRRRKDSKRTSKGQTTSSGHNQARPAASPKPGQIESRIPRRRSPPAPQLFKTVQAALKGVIRSENTRQQQQQQQQQQTINKQQQQIQEMQQQIKDLQGQRHRERTRSPPVVAVDRVRGDENPPRDDNMLRDPFPRN